MIRQVDGMFLDQLRGTVFLSRIDWRVEVEEGRE